MIHPQYLADLISTVLLHTPFPDRDRAVPLLLGTAAQESGLVHFRQLNNGPARGLFQMEPQTEKDHVAFTKRHEWCAETFVRICGVMPGNLWHLEHNIPYQILMCRLHYYVRDKERLPAADDLAAQARTYKRVYNTARGKATPQQYIDNYQRLIAPRVKL